MNKRKILTLLIAIGLTSTLSVSNFTQHTEAQTAKSTTTVAGATYYGELKNGLPHGKGKLEWSSNKWYTGEFVQGKRSGTGKYLNEYIDSNGETLRVVYNGSWKNDQMNGTGTLTEKVTNDRGQFYLSKIRTGQFVNNVWKSGYDVGHVIGDPDYSYLYKGNDMTLSIWGTNDDLLERWNNGSNFWVQYQKGSVYKEYSMFYEDTEAKEKIRLETLRYLKGITSQVKPHFKIFEQLAKQVPIPRSN